MTEHNRQADGATAPAEAQAHPWRARAPERRWGRAEWLALGLALAVHMVAFALAPGPVNTALRRAPEILLSVNLEQAEPVRHISVVAEQRPSRIAEPSGQAGEAMLPADQTAGRDKSRPDVRAETPPRPDEVGREGAVVADARPADQPDQLAIWADLSEAVESVALLPDTAPAEEDGGTADIADRTSDAEAEETGPAGASEPPAESPEPGPAADADAEALLRQYAAEVKRRIMAQKYYPAAAERLGHTGQVRVGFTIGAGGELRAVHVKDGSGHRALDEAALDAVRRAGRFPPVPPALGRDSLDLALTLRYSLD